MKDAQFWAELPDRLRAHREWQDQEAQRMANDLWRKAIKEAHRRKRKVEEMMELSERVGMLRRRAE